MSEAIIVLIILGVAATLFFTEVIPLPATAMLVPIGLSLAGILEPEVAFSYWGNKWVIIFMAMFMVGEAVFRTGLAKKIGNVTVKAAGRSRVKLIVLVMLVIGVMSAFLSNTGSTAVFIPIVIAMAVGTKVKASTLLMPMAFAASLGGTMTLIGTPPNGIVAGVLDEAEGLEPFGFFEYAKIGVFMIILGTAYMAVIGHKLLPTGEDSNAQAEASDKDIPDEQLRKSKMWIAVVIFVFVIFAMATGLIPFQTAAMLGAVAAIVTGCITMKEAFNSVSWTTVFLFAGMLPMSKAMEITGAAEMIAQGITDVVSSPYGILAATFLVTALITNFMSNTATTALFAPIGIAIAQKAGV
ncbi:MAG: SLC13 family permease, partial [Pelovirga sp.]